MAFAFKPALSLPAKPAFGTYYPNLTSGEYTYYKKTKGLFCNYCPNPQLNLTKLNVNLITTLDLSDCCTIQTNPSSPATPSCNVAIPPPSSSNPPFYATYTIDPYGVLFGQTQCGNNNFLKRLVYNCPSSKEINYNNTLNINPYN
jgi:hypothetical protein